MLARLDELLAATPDPAQSTIDQAFYHACQGGQLRAAQRLLAAGADTAAVPDYAGHATALDMALSPDTRREQLATWLREQGATAAASDGE
jgi:hypothetical protein